MSDGWFSAMIRFAVSIGESGTTVRNRSVVLVRAADWPAAKSRVLEVGIGMEETYIGGKGEEVKIRLEAIETLDQLGEDIPDGREVYAESIDLPESEAAPDGGKFQPEASEPTQSGV